MKFLKTALIFITLGFCLGADLCMAQDSLQNQYGNWQGMQIPVPEWFKDARFGIYFHWGVYTVPAFNSEWYSRNMYVPGTKAFRHQIKKYGSLSDFGYKDFIPMFKAPHFDADRWVDLFVRAGAKFAGPVAEHADGFSMWDSDVNPWNAKDMGPKIDVVGAMEKAVRKRGLKFIATFHHQWHWGWYPTFNDTVDAGNPTYRKLYGPVVPKSVWKQKDDAPKPDEAFCKTWAVKVSEVISGYHPDILYFDSRLGHIKEEYRKQITREYLHVMQQKEKQGVILRKHQDLPDVVSVRNYEKSRIHEIGKKVWQTEETISTYSWSYTQQMKIRSATNILHSLIDVVSKNGVYLLNISPKSNGTIPENQRKVLLNIGQWLGKYGEAIYGSSPWYTYGEGPEMKLENKKKKEDKKFYKRKYSSKDVRYTRKDDTIYAIIMGRPGEQQVLLQGFAKDRVPRGIYVKQILLLNDGTEVNWSYRKDGLHIKLPYRLPSKMANVLKITLAK